MTAACPDPLPGAPELAELTRDVLARARPEGAAEHAAALLWAATLRRRLLLDQVELAALKAMLEGRPLEGLPNLAVLTRARNRLDKDLVGAVELLNELRQERPRRLAEARPASAAEPLPAAPSAPGHATPEPRLEPAAAASAVAPGPDPARPRVEPVHAAPERRAEPPRARPAPWSEDLVTPRAATG